MYLEDSEYDYIVDELQRALALLDKIEKSGYVLCSTQAKEDNHMAQITGGLVSVEDSKPHSNDEYGRKKVRVDLSFAVGDGEDYGQVFDLASEAASNRVLSLLNGTALRVVTTGGENLAGNGTTDGEPAPARKRRRTAAEIAADNALALAAHPKGDPASMVDDEPPAPEDDPANVGGDEPKDPAGLDDFSIEPEETGDEPITDAALNAAVQRKNAELGDPEAIRAVIKLYNPDPTKAFQLREIPQDKRAEFITKLGGLTKASA